MALAAVLAAAGLAATPARAADSASVVCGGQGTKDQELCILATATAATMATPGYSSTLQGSVGTWVRHVNTDPPPPAGGPGPTETNYSANDQNAPTVAGKFSGRASSRIAPTSFFQSNGMNGHNGVGEGVASLTTGTGMTYRYQRWIAVLNYDSGHAGTNPNAFGVDSLYFNYPRCTQTGARRDFTSDCQNGFLTEWHNTSDHSGPVQISSNLYRGTVSIVRETSKITQGIPGKASRTGSGSYSFTDRISGLSRTLTTTWKIGTATSVAERITASYSNPKILTVTSTH